MFFCEPTALQFISMGPTFDQFSPYDTLFILLSSTNEKMILISSLLVSMSISNWYHMSGPLVSHLVKKWESCQKFRYYSVDLAIVIF